MTKALRNFWLDLALALLLILNIVLLVLPLPIRTRTHISFVGHIHAISGTLMLLLCLIHIGLHWQWFQAVLAGKVNGRIKLVMNSLVAVLMIVAVLSGRAAVAFVFAGRPHGLIGYFVMLGLVVHAVKHTRWMASMIKRLIAGTDRRKAQQSA